jgi:acetolactate synthase-1/2/3 large subunit
MRDQSNTMTGARALVKSIAAHGIDTLFGLPGAHLYEFYDALYDYRDSMRVVSSRHEQGAAYMAFGYSFSTGKIGAYAVVPGPGVLNTTAALLTAYGCCARVLCITAEIPSHGIGRGIGFLHELPGQLDVMRHVTKWAARIDRAADAPRTIAEAVRQLRHGRPRPVEIEMPIDIMSSVAEMHFPSPLPPPAPAAPDPDQVNAAARLLGRAERPLIMVGGGAVDAGAEVFEIADALQAPVVSWRHGRGIVSDRHYLSQSYPAGNRLWAEADVVLAVGTRLKYPLLYWGTQGLDIIRIDIDPAELDRVEAPRVGIAADARAGLAALGPAIARHNRRRISRREELERLKASMRSSWAHLEPQLSYLRAIREALPEDGILVDEITQVGFVSWFDFPVYRPRHFISSGYQGTLGYGFATAIGVQIANPGKKVVHIAGDGGFLYTMPELATAVQHGIPLVTVVFRDDRFGSVYRDQKTKYHGRLIGAELHNPDFVALARSFGAEGMRASGPDALRASLLRAFDAAGPVIIDVPVGEMPNAWEFAMLPRVRGTDRPLPPLSASHTDPRGEYRDV